MSSSATLLATLYKPLCLCEASLGPVVSNDVDETSAHMAREKGGVGFGLKSVPGVLKPATFGPYWSHFLPLDWAKILTLVSPLY